MSDDLTTAYMIGYACAKDMATDEITRLRAENEKLRAALKPFALSSRYYWSDTNDDYLISDDKELTMGDLRAAAAALGETDE